jgi:NADH:ubiquinone oxidoreductase subunit 6 (subunit J)
MVEVYLFIVVGAVAIIAATLMLLSDNAVHSALFLILNFACVAFMYLMLDAPFLAMVQVAVYAGAIMVLFLFVIMLLGAEQAESESSDLTEMAGSRYHTWVALVLALVTLVAVAVGIGRGEVDALGDNGEPILRVVNAAAVSEIVDVSLDGEMIGEQIPYRQSTGFFEVAAGTYVLSVTEHESGEVLYEGEVAVEAPEIVGAVTTAVVYGAGETDIATFTQDFSAPPERQARLTVFNAFDQAVSLQDVGVFSRDGDGTVLASSIEPGETSLPVLIDAGEYDSLRLVRPADEENDATSVNAFFTVADREFTRNSSTLFVLASQPGSELPVVTIAAERTMMQFGSPQAVGEMLFTRYVLPLQAVGLLLLAALVGVIVIAQRQVAGAAQPSAARRPVRRRVSRPLASVVAAQVQSDGNDDTPALRAGDSPAGD